MNRLGLNSIGPFDPSERIIEYMLPEDRVGPLAQKTLAQFIHVVGARTPTPGGGSVAAAVASLGAALGAMVGKMTYGKRQWEKYDEQMRRLIPIMHHTMDQLIPMVDADTGAFNDYMVRIQLQMHGLPPLVFFQQLRARLDSIVVMLDENTCLMFPAAAGSDKNSQENDCIARQV